MGYPAVMSLRARFIEAMVQSYDAVTACPELVPMVLCQACVQVLPVAGAGLSITDRLRVPLGSSDDDVARAERLQTTLGEGPCLTATANEQPYATDLATIAARWPMFYREFTASTPFRSVVALPLLGSRSQLRCGALDLYFTEPDTGSLLPDSFLAEIRSAVADTIADVLFGNPSTRWAKWGYLPPWMNTSAVTNRMHVWVAVGILTEHAGLQDVDALAALRAYAYSHDSTLDDIADKLMTERLQPHALIG